MVLVSIEQSVKDSFSPPFRPVVNGFSGHAKHLGNRIQLQLGVDDNEVACIEIVVREMMSSGCLFQ
jgi:hypothetical protein